MDNPKKVKDRKRIITVENCSSESDYSAEEKKANATESSSSRIPMKQRRSFSLKLAVED